MPATLTAIFRATDEMSATLRQMAQNGQDMVSTYEMAANEVSNTIGSVEGGCTSVSSAVQSATESMGSGFTNYSAAAQDATSQSRQFGNTIGQVEESAGDAAEAAEELAEASEQAGDELEEAGRDGAGAMEELSKVLTTLGIAKVIKEITGALLECSAAAAQVETSAAKVQTIMDSSQASITQVEASVRSLSAETGIAVTDLNNTVYDAISATSDTANSVTNVATATKLATAGFAETGSALGVLSTIMNSYKMSADDLLGVSDSLIMTQNLGVTTVGDLSQQMGRAIATASAYSVDLYNLEAAYIATTKSGIATAESTTYISSMLNELGKSSSTVSKVLQEDTGKSFGQLMQEGYSLSDVLGILMNSVDGNAEAMMNLWGSAEAGKAASAIVNQGLTSFNQNLETLENSCGTTQTAYETMAQTTEFAHQRMTNSAELLQAAIGEKLNPVMSSLYTSVADVTTGITAFVEAHPAVTAALAAITTTGTILLGGIAAYNIAIPVASAVTTAFNAVLALNPAVQIAMGVALATTAIITFGEVMSANTEEAEHWTSATIQQQEELNFLTAKYDDICARYGDTSEEALRLKNQIDDLSASFERDKQTIDEFVAECDSVVQAHDNMVSAYHDSASAQKDSEVQSLALIQRLSDLASQSQHTEADTQAMNAIIGELNSTYSDLNLTLDDVLSNSSDVVGSLKDMAQAEAEAQREQQAYDDYVAALNDQASIESKLTKATAEKEQAQKRLNEAQATYNELVQNSMSWDGSISGNVDHSKEADELARAREEYEKATGAVDELNASKEETTAILSEIEQGWEQQAEAARQAAEGTAQAAMSEEEIVSEAWGSIQSDLEALCARYDEAYDHALTSIEGQYDLWEKAADMSETTSEDLDKMMGDLNSALDSQISYWESYASSLENLSSRNIEGLSDMVASMDDGSEKSAAALQAMANASDDELQAMVAKYGDLQSAQQQTASDTAALKTNFNSELDAMQAKMEETIKKMDDSGGAASAAKSTMSAYISELKSKGNEAVSEAQSIASRISSALSKAKGSTSVTTHVVGRATGTVSAQEDVFLAGEEGPELIVGHKGSTVFPAGETDRIIDAISAYDGTLSSLSSSFSSGQQDITMLPASLYASEGETTPLHTSGLSGSSQSATGGQDVSNGAAERRIVIEIAGSGAISVDGGASPEEIVRLMQDNLEPVLIGILQDNILEEGDESYEF